MINEEFRSELLKVLKEFHNFCEEHKLIYYLIGGGLIGAIRHKGFIPWDDDIDVAMPREDYEKFLQLKEGLSSDFNVAEPFKADDYSNTMVRMYSTKYLIQQDFIKKFTIGPWIDVFPLDYTFDNHAIRKFHFSSVYLLKVLNACRLGGIQVTGGLKSKAKLGVYYMLSPVPKNTLANIFNKVITIKKKPSRYMANLTGRWREKELIETAELANRSLYDFESIEIFSFTNYDKWLSRVYGEYMQLPAEHKRTPDHSTERVQ